MRTLLLLVVMVECVFGEDTESSQAQAKKLAFDLPPDEVANLTDCIGRAKGIYATPRRGQLHVPAPRLASSANAVLVTTCNRGWINMLYSFSCALQELHLKYLLFVQEIKLWQELQQEAEEQDALARRSYRSTMVPYFSPTFARHYAVSAAASMFKRPSFNRAGILKLHAVLVVLRLGVDVWLVDMDVAFIRDPWPAWNLALPDCDFDVFAYFHKAVSTASFKDFNSGYFRAKANERVIALFEDTIELSAKMRTEVEQTIINKAFVNWMRAGRLRFLPSGGGDGDPAPLPGQSPLQWCTVTKCTHPDGLLRLQSNLVRNWTNVSAPSHDLVRTPVIYHPNCTPQHEESNPSSRPNLCCYLDSAGLSNPVCVQT